MNTILGGMFQSRLNANIREEKGYSYGVVGLRIRQGARIPSARAATSSATRPTRRSSSS
jgi:predicted Zn-dependent peptidase